ncbi:hypothetical protein VP01_1201g6 [Puccinia sorghi]|uniref:COP9 signalosome complex subunit 3 n=1 Tax=Puccinia sorghi TaxID=27349 RepID=A0A0L6VQP2_9BASI|nr:hypothetical protein VP01_1201g6 [Puccinia sorghi]
MTSTPRKLSPKFTYFRESLSFIHSRDVCLFASLLVECSSQAGQLQSSIEPLWQLIQSYAPLNILTPLHHELVKVLFKKKKKKKKKRTYIHPNLYLYIYIYCHILQISLKTRSIDQALELTNMDIDIDQQNYPIRYQDHLIYHYLAGIVQALAKNYPRAIHLLTMVRSPDSFFSAPGSAISQIQVDAYKKLILVSLLTNSSPAVLPPYTNPHFKGAFKNAPNTKAYLDFMNSYERAETSSEAYVQLVTLAERNMSIFQKVCSRLSITRHYLPSSGVRLFTDKMRSFFTQNQDNNSGLIKLCIEVLPQKAIKKLTPIYTSIPITKIDRLLGNLTEGNASGLVQSMIQSGELKAQIDPNTNVVMFADEEETLEDPEKTQIALKQIIERVQVMEQTILAKSAEVEQDKELLKRLIQDLRNSSAEKQQLPSSNDLFQAGPGIVADRLSSGIIEEELVDVGMSWDD